VNPFFDEGKPMLNTFRKLTNPPIFEHDEKTRVAGILNSIFLFIIPLASLATLFIIFASPTNFIPFLSLIGPSIILLTFAYYLMRRGYVSAASTIFLGVIGAVLFGVYLLTHSGSTTALLNLAIVIAFTTLLLRPRAIIILLIAIIIFTLVVTIARTQGLITPIFSPLENPFSDWIISTVSFSLIGLGLYFSSASLKRALSSASDANEQLETSNKELTELQEELELRVQDQTSALGKRTVQLQAISSVTRSIASLQSLDELLPAITRLVSERFDFYHTGIFLIDHKEEFAELKAANSEGGRRMLERQHKLRLDSNSLVGFATSRGEPRIALDVGTDAVYFDNLDLPDTRSEMALPLRVGGRVTGALDVQSTEPNAFSDTDINTVSTLADLVAIAIENARLFTEAQEALNRSEETFSQYIRQEWGSFAKQLKISGYKFDGSRTIPLGPNENREKVKELPKTGNFSRAKDHRALSIPIKFRGQVIGILDVKSKNRNRNWTPDDITLLEAAVERTALALENIRLVESSQRRAARERTIGEIATKISAVSDIETIMQTAVEELGRKIGGAAEVTLELESESERQ
jgi:GAF domain-containing protein